MVGLLDSFRDITFNQAIWLLPLFYLIHFLEELPRFPDWAKKSLRKPYTRPKFIVENIVLWMILTVSVLMTVYFPGKAGILLVLSAAIAFFLNMTFHAIFTLKTGIYSPGTVTACLFFAPVSFYLFFLAAKEGLLDLTTVVLSMILGVAMLPAVVAAVHHFMDSEMTLRSFIKKVILMGVLPFIVVSIAMMIWGRETVHRIMIYTSPLIVLPLIAKILKKRKEQKKSNTTS
jgi:hypothetical protein